MRSVRVDCNPMRAEVNYTRDGKDIKNIIIVGNEYKIAIDNPKSEKDKKNNGRTVKVLGFNNSHTENYVIIRYLDNNRKGKAEFDRLLPYNNE